MENTTSQSLKFFRGNKDRQLLLNYLRKIVLEKEGLSLAELHKKYSEEYLFYLSLKHVTTTKKAICKAFNINIDNACRYKRNFEKRGFLVQSTDQKICPYTGYPAHFLTTDPRKFKELEQSDQTQLF